MVVRESGASTGKEESVHTKEMVQRTPTFTLSILIRRRLVMG